MTKRKTQPKTIKRAAIYVRVSSERQGEKASPQAQEADCRALCESKGYQVVEVYRDVEKYRVGRKLVEPSGTRADRPGLRAVLAAARAGEIDLIVAWREDRLYRSYRPMLDVLDTLEDTGIDIELAKETFDRKIAPVKAWAAKMELDAKQDRFMMGVAGRLSKGKAWNHEPPYGYESIDGFYQPQPDEARWIAFIWQQYADDGTIPDIRRSLIAGGAPQRHGGRHPWRPQYIRRILRHKYYFTGDYRFTWGGEEHELHFPPIVDAETGSRVMKRRESYKAYPAGNLKGDYLAAGLITCEACGNKMRVFNNPGRKRKDGTRGVYMLYRCYMVTHGTRDPGCAGSVSTKRVDADVWGKLWPILSEPGKLEAAMQEQIEAFRAEQTDALACVDKLTQQLDDLFMQRQWVITQARTKKITQEDMEGQLAALDWQEASHRHELSQAQLATGNRSEMLLARAKRLRHEVAAGGELLALAERTPEQEADIFAFKREMVMEYVERVDVKPDKSVKLHFRMTLAEAEPGESGPSESEPMVHSDQEHANSLAGTRSHVETVITLTL